MPLKFGKLPPKANPATLSLKKYLVRHNTMAPEAKRAWEYAVPDSVWAESMLGNDELGLCVEAAAMHYIMAATATTHKRAVFTKEQCIELYSSVTGYNPHFPNTDQGTAWTDMLDFWKREGIYGHKITAWASINYKDLNALRQGMDIFGGILVGTQVTGSMEDQFAAGQPWNKPFKGGVVGLHGIPWLGYGREGQTCITWAKRQPMDLHANTICDEAYVVITDDWLNAAFTTPLGIDAPQLAADIEALRIA